MSLLDNLVVVMRMAVGFEGRDLESSQKSLTFADNVGRILKSEFQKRKKVRCLSCECFYSQYRTSFAEPLA
jgi:hypothetical protein